MCALHHDQTSSVEVFYHDDCIDGHGAAFILWLDLRNQEKVKVNFTPVQYKSKLPDITGKIVYILDLFYPYEDLTQMIEQAKALLLIDHHRAAQEKLTKIPDRYKIIDVKESATTLTWKYLHPDEPVPPLFRQINSRDLAFKLAFGLAIRNEEGNYDFHLTEKYLKEKELENLVSIGKILLVYHNNLVEKSMRKMHFCPIRRESHLLIVAYVNTLPSLADTIGDRCMNNYPFVDFCACFYFDPSARTTYFLLRSKDGRQDVSVIAEEHGGTGHYNASECQLKGTISKLNYDHLNPWPLWCIYTNRKLKIKRESIDECLTPDYLQLLQLRFPGRTLKIELDLSE